MNNFIFEGYERTADSEPFYEKSYHFHSADNITGYWYKILLPEPICYEESFFNVGAKGVPYVEVVPKWTGYVKYILSFYINQSPVNKIAVLLRVQDSSNDTVHSDCSIDEFVRELTIGNIKWNELYVVY